MKVIRWYPRRGREELKIETPGGVIVIEPGLYNSEGRPVTAVSVSPDQAPWAGEEWVAKYGKREKTGLGIRFVAKKTRHERTR
jgi:hypothetical protein